MVKMEFDLTEEQAEKVEILKSKDVDVGQAIDLLFELQSEMLGMIEEQQNDPDILEKLQDTGFDSKIKAELLKKNFEENATVDRTVMDAKHMLKWSEFLKF